MMYHGWTLSGEKGWEAGINDIAGLYNKGVVIKNLLDNGYAVVSPNAVTVA